MGLSTTRLMTMDSTTATAATPRAMHRNTTAVSDRVILKAYSSTDARAATAATARTMTHAKNT